MFSYILKYFNELPTEKLIHLYRNGDSDIENKIKHYLLDKLVNNPGFDQKIIQKEYENHLFESIVNRLENTLVI